MVDRFLNNKYKLDRVENFDEFFAEMGMNAVIRKVAKNLPTVVQLTKEGDKYSLNTKIILFSTSQVFTPGEEVEVEKTADGRKIVNIFTIEGNKLIEKQIELKNARTLTITREFFDEQMIVKSTYGGIVCTSWCKLVRD